MKRTTIIAVSLAALFLAGCGTVSADRSLPVDSPVRQNISLSAIHPQDIIKNGTYIPEHIRVFYTALEEYAALHSDVHYTISAGPEFREPAPGFCYYGIGLEDSVKADYAIVFGSTEGTAKKSFHINFNAEANGLMMKDVITACFLATDGTLTEEEAAGKMRELTGTYCTDSTSACVSSGEYVALIKPDGFKYATHNSTLYFLHKDELTSVLYETADSYSPLDYSRAMLEMDRGEKVTFNVVVEEVYFEDTTIIGDRKMFSLCATDEGRYLYVTVKPESMTEDYKAGGRYTIYGRIGAPYNDLPWIEMDGAVRTEG